MVSVEGQPMGRTDRSARDRDLPLKPNSLNPILRQEGIDELQDILPVHPEDAASPDAVLMPE